MLMFSQRPLVMLYHSVILTFSSIAGFWQSGRMHLSDVDLCNLHWTRKTTFTLSPLIVETLGTA